MGDEALVFVRIKYYNNVIQNEGKKDLVILV